ncbi:MAG: hypothetical protein KGJ75_08725 [Alphaproteobacteria bacterium]|nr:hypothetical protein [Alphaproteobacteria bacterium]MDE2072387.1 hypothetical protein [Alphaproteobacteria bacterium]
MFESAISHLPPASQKKEQQVTVELRHLWHFTSRAFRHNSMTGNVPPSISAFETSALFGRRIWRIT